MRLAVRRITLVLWVVALAVVSLAPSAAAKEFSLPRARVVARIDAHGAVHVTEYLTYSFSGSFSGGYREIPLRRGEEITNISVKEGNKSYRSGASAELGSDGDPDTFGVKDLGDAARIVWHYIAIDERRTFAVSYTLKNFAVAHDDVVEVNLQVWGDEWSVGLQLLRAQMLLPPERPAPGDVRVWGHPARVEGATELVPKGAGASLYAIDVPPQQWVEMRMTFPRSVLRSTRHARVAGGAAFADILAEEQALVEDDQREREARDRVLKLLPLAALLAIAPGIFIALWVWRRYGREPRVPAVPEHLMEPPGDDPPALIPALL